MQTHSSDPVQNNTSLALPSDPYEPLTECSMDVILMGLRHFHKPNEIIELRQVRPAKGYYFAGVSAAAEQAAGMSGHTNVYQVINPFDRALISRGLSSPVLTRDVDITRRVWYFLDFDPVRDAGTGATAEQLEHARNVASGAIKDLCSMGWPQPTAAISGNGVHVFFPIDMDNGEAATALLKSATNAVRNHCKDDGDIVDVDRTVYTAAHLTKVYGTLAVKGKDTLLHRFAQVLHYGTRDQLVTTEMLTEIVVAWGAKRGRPAKPDSEKQVKGTRGYPVTMEWLNDWMTQFGVVARGHKVINGVDATVVYCPWINEHSSDAKSDAAVWLGASDDKPGLKFRCFHAHCADRTWEDFRSFHDRAYADKHVIANGDLPPVTTNERRAIDVVTDTVDVLAQSNNPVKIFQEGDNLLVLKVNGSQARLRRMDADLLRVEAIKRISFVATVKDKNGDVHQRSCWPSRDLLSAVLNLGEWSGIPTCNMVTDTPLFAPDGTLHSTKGYSDKTNAYLSTNEFAFPDDLKAITRASALNSRNWILDNVLVDFPFARGAGWGDSCRQHAMAAILQHAVCRIIASYTPVYLVEASASSSGKGLLGTVISVPYSRLMITPLSTNEEEVAKALHGVLDQSPTHVMFDNVKHHVSSATLEGVLTAPVFTTRVLGISRMADHSTTATTWLISANNATFSTDLMKRSVLIRLEPDTANPEARKDFVHPELVEWLTAHRAEYVRHVLTICGYWVAQGMTSYAGPHQHRASRWAAVMGGILEAIDFAGDFLSNAVKLADGADPDASAWDEFVGVWWDLQTQAGTTTERSANDLYVTAFGDPEKTLYSQQPWGPLSSIVAAPGENQRRAQLSKRLLQKKGAVFALGNDVSVKLMFRSSKTHGCRYWLEPVRARHPVVRDPLEDDAPAPECQEIPDIPGSGQGEGQATLLSYDPEVRYIDAISA